MSMFSPRTIKGQYDSAQLDLPLPSSTSTSGRTYIITGSNTGLGLECAIHLVSLGASRVILAVRSQAKGDAAKVRIETETKRKGVAEVWLIDQSSYESVKTFAERASALKRIDGVLLNASVALDTLTFAEGLETQITVNLISTFLLAALLLPKLKRDARIHETQPVISIVGSAIAFMGLEGVLEKRKGDLLETLSTKSGFPNMPAATQRCVKPGLRNRCSQPTNDTQLFGFKASPDLRVSTVRIALSPNANRSDHQSPEPRNL